MLNNIFETKNMKKKGSTSYKKSNQWKVESKSDKE